MNKFIGRKAHLENLTLLKKKTTASLVVIKGRRRIGKSRLAEEFGKTFSKVYTFPGLPPDEKITAKSQRIEFIRQLQEQRIPSKGGNDWGELFNELAQYASSGEVLLVLDEIT